MNSLADLPQYNTKDDVWKRQQLLFSAVSKTDSWFTGLPIKQYLNKTLFNQDDGVLNQIIQAGRWSAYAHFSPVSAFQNLLNKHGIDSHKTVVVHPFLPPEFVDELQQRSCKILSLDISKETLQWDAEKFENWLKIEISTQPVDLVISVLINGLGTELEAIMRTCHQAQIPTLLFVSTPHITPEIKSVLSAQTMGSVLIVGGDSVLSNQLNLFLKSVQLAAQKVYFSWFLETRAQALLEYHLRDSQPVVKRLLSAYFYLVNQQYKSFGLLALAYSSVSQSVAEVDNFSSVSQAEEAVKESYYQMFLSALPDIFFTLENQFPLQTNSNAFANQPNSTFSSSLQSFYQFMIQQVHQQPEGALEVPAINFARSYSAFHIFSTNADFDNFLQQNGFLLSTFPPVAQQFADPQKFPNTNICSRFGLILMS